VIVGGGVAGIQASLDLANRGLKVYLVEKTPSIGGKMALLDKTFPTMDCAICILAPKMIEVYRHPNVELLTYSEIKEVDGEAGNFKVKILRKARFIDESRCVGCGICASKCPTKVSDEYQLGLAERKAVYMPFTQSVPLIYCIDSRHCLYLNKGICRVCEKNCPANAIDFEQKDEVIEVEASSIVISTGLETYDPSPIKEYGYGRFKNVVTAFELERLMTATGPTGGELLKPSDKKHPQEVVFIQCVGSRSLDEGYPYCSSVCCMHATKEGILVKEHDSKVKVTILYTDLRAFGKGFKDFVNRAREEYGIEYIRGKPAEIREDPETSRLTFWVENTQTGEVFEKSCDILTLCTALIPSSKNNELAKIMGIEIDKYGFFKRPDPLLSPLSTSKEGIFVCGFSQGPKDIPDSIAEASGASALAVLTTNEKGGVVQ
jgi:heterodisulfide reductase subunit A